MLKRFGLPFFLVFCAWASPGIEHPACAQENAPPEKARPEGPVRSQVDLVSVYFTVRDNQKRLVTDLPQDRFVVAEDGRPQAIKFFAHHSDVVLNVGVLLDTGTNMSWILGEEAQASTMF
ncbi:MAG TPA: hypothetical protein VKB21_07485, partial [Candidatus Acidoferrum sp.]|nr:hypothetical protein [Candidatus Acidoferrum sp.]